MLLGSPPEPGEKHFCVVGGAVEPYEAKSIFFHFLPGSLWSPVEKIASSRLGLWIGVAALPVMLLVIAAALVLQSRGRGGRPRKKKGKSATTPTDERNGSSRTGNYGSTVASSRRLDADVVDATLSSGLDDGMGEHPHMVSDLRDKALRQAEAQERQRQAVEDKAIKARARAIDADRATVALDGARPALDDGMDGKDNGDDDEIYEADDYLMDDI